MTRNKKVILVARSHPYFGGVERWIGNLYRTLEATDIDYRFIFLEGRVFNNPEKFTKAQGIKDYRTIRVISGSIDAKKSFLRKAIADERPDIVIPILSVDALEAASDLKQDMNFKIVVPTHEYNIQQHEDLLRFKGSIDQIVTVDKLYLKYLKWTLKAEGLEISQIPSSYPNHLKLDEFQPSYLDRNVLNVGFCGRLSSQVKRSALFIKIIERFSKDDRIVFHWMGATKESLYKNSICKLALNNNKLIAHGNLYGEDNRTFFDQIDAAIICSSAETGPLFAWEAMISRKLLICSRYLGLRTESFLKHQENCLLFDVDDEETCYRLLLSAVEDFQQFRSLITQAFQDVSKMRSPKKESQSWISLLGRFENEPTLTHSKLPFEKTFLMLNYFQQHLFEVFRRLFRKRYQPRSALAEWLQYTPAEDIEANFIKSLTDFERRNTCERENQSIK